MKGKNMYIKILTFLLTSATIYLALSAVLIFIGTPKKRIPSEKSLAFNELRFDYSPLPNIQKYEARDGASLSYRPGIKTII